MAVPPWADCRASIDGKQFERFVAEVLRGLGSGLDRFRVEEQEIVTAPDGRYRIDVTARFQALNADFLILIECKDHSRPVEREDVQVLADKKRAVGAQKAMLFSTNGFQRGAIEYAANHGVALIRVMEGALTWETRGFNPGIRHAPPPWAKIPPYVAQYIRAGDRSGHIRTTTLQADTSADLIEFLARPQR
jgi:restriction system protein